MTKNFEQKVIRNGIVDTAKYRYVYKEDVSRGCKIVRIALNLLGTTAAIDGWEVVKEYDC